MTPRHYPFVLPHPVTGIAGASIAYAVGNMPEVQAALARLPAPLVAKVHQCGFWSVVIFSKADLDLIPDDLWAKLAPHLT